MKFKTLLILVAIIAGIAAAYFLASDNNSRSVENLDHVVKYIAPEGYNVTGQVHELQTTEKGQRVALLPRQFDTGEFTRKPDFARQEGFVGPESCKECHADYYNGFIETAHYKTSAFANKSSILGSFEAGENVMETKQPGFRFELTEKDGQFLQSLLVDDDGKTYSHNCQFDIVTGSGNAGQTYLYWQDDFLFQLPVSWFAKAGWVNSPGYPDGFADFARPVGAGCLTCHSTRIEYSKNRVNLADKETIILGVTCERCHGPAESHVKFHRENPDADGAKFITHPNDLPRERMNDICGQCHAGGGVNLKPPFDFRPGDSIEDFKHFKKEPTTGGSVHTANQHPRLIKSKCYLESDSMNCATCHNPHRNEHGNVKLFSSRCMKCHEPEHCGQFADSGQRITSNCIGCHMPKQNDENTKMEAADKEFFPEIRDHFIRIEKESSREVLDEWARNDQQPKPGDKQPK